jgi:coproporphyrinogen III oxidase-like Fe-S oxidoreductase
MLPVAKVPADHAESVPVSGDDAQVLRDRMQKPQRHRLLHGYPLAAAMHRRDRGNPTADVLFEPHAGRNLLVGVLPHPFCNPTLPGCGFCTFPHERYHAGRAGEVVEHVLREIDNRLAHQPALAGRRVAALYFGGGTANLTPAGPFRWLCRRLAAAFDLSGAEVTLEGVPAYFVLRQPLLIDIMREEMPARHFRLSMGVQTFDEERLRQMGRLAFGTAETFAKVVELAHARGFTASADLLFNLPGQSLLDMGQDVEHAVRIGLDHLGLYHLVLFRGLGTAWSQDPALLAGLPTNEQAAGHWLKLRELLFNCGFVQTTLTNFEQAHYRGNDRRFLFEELSFQADAYDMAGFGPGAISFAAAVPFTYGLKVLNPDAAEAYVAAVRSRRPPWDRYFEYDSTDLRIFYLTRRLAGLEIDRRHYARLFGTDPMADFPGAFSALLEEGLVEVTPTAVRPTPRGMFYADSIAALLAWRQIDARRNGMSARSLSVPPREAEKPRRSGNDNSAYYM